MQKCGTAGESFLSQASAFYRSVISFQCMLFDLFLSTDSIYPGRKAPTYFTLHFVPWGWEPFCSLTLPTWEHSSHCSVITCLHLSPGGPRAGGGMNSVKRGAGFGFSLVPPVLSREPGTQKCLQRAGEQAFWKEVLLLQISLVEKYIEEQLLERIPGFNMAAFTTTLQWVELDFLYFLVPCSSSTLKIHRPSFFFPLVLEHQASEHLVVTSWVGGPPYLWRKSQGDGLCHQLFMKQPPFSFSGTIKMKWPVTFLTCSSHLRIFWLLKKCFWTTEQ